MFNVYLLFSAITVSFIFLYMPQLVPFYFVNQITFCYILFMVILWISSKYILPNITLTSYARMSLLNPYKKWINK